MCTRNNKKPTLSDGRLNMKVEERTLAFIGYQMYYLGKTKEELDSMSWLEVVMEQDDFDRMKVDETSYKIEV